MQYKIVLVSTLAGLASAYFQPDTSKAPSGNAITAPLNEVVPGGKPFQITWTPSTPGQVSILLLKGPKTNVQYLATIADQVANTGSYTWNVDPTLVPQDSGYAIEIVAQDRTYQYSTQIGIGKADKAQDSGSSSTGAVVSYGGVETAPPSSGAEGTAECGALAECPKTSAPATTATAAPVTSSSPTSQAVAIVPTAGTGTGNLSSPIITPTVPMSMPTGLAGTAASAGNPGVQTSISTAVVAASGAAGSGAAPAASSSGKVSTGVAAPGAKLSGVAALVAGFIGFLAL